MNRNEYYIKVFSFILFSVLIINDIAMPLGIAPGTLDPKIKAEWDAAGQKQFAEKWGPGSIDFDLSGMPGEFIEAPLEDIDGMAFLPADYNNLPDAWKKNPLFKKILCKNDTPGKITSGDQRDTDDILVSAFKFYAKNEAMIPDGVLDIRVEPFDVKENSGELPIARIEKYSEDRYGMIIHPKFAEAWGNIIRNDIWIKCNTGMNKEAAAGKIARKDEQRTISLAWALFYRIAKHEMTDLRKISGVSKGLYRGHLTYYPGGGENDLFATGTLFENTFEEEANMIEGKYAAVNDAAWLWFLGSYCFSDTTRYNNHTFGKRIDWFFSDKLALKMNFASEFPNLKNDRQVLSKAKTLAMWINHRFFSRADIGPVNIGTMDEERSNLYLFQKDIAKYLVSAWKSKKIKSGGASRIVENIRDRLIEYVGRSLVHAARNSGIKPTRKKDLQDIFFAKPSFGEDGIDTDLNEKIIEYALRIVAKAIDNKYMGIDDKLWDLSTEHQSDLLKEKISSLIPVVFVCYFGKKHGFLTTPDSYRQIGDFVKGFKREFSTIKIFSSTGKDSETERLENLFMSIASSTPIQDKRRKMKYFTAGDIISAEDIDLPKGYSKRDLEKDLEAMAKRGYYDKYHDSARNVDGYAKKRRERLGIALYAVEKGILDKKIKDAFASQGTSSILDDNGIIYIRDLVLREYNDLLGLEIDPAHYGGNRSGLVNMIAKELKNLGLSIKHPQKSFSEWAISILDLELNNCQSLDNETLALLRKNNIRAFRDIISKTRQDLSGFMDEQTVENISNEIESLGLSLKPLQAKDKRRKEGRSPETALAVVRETNAVKNALKEKGYFTIRDFHKGYDEIKYKYGFKPLPAKRPDSQTRRDLDRLCETGALIRYGGFKENRYRSAEKNAGKPEKLAEYVLDPAIDEGPGNTESLKDAQKIDIWRAVGLMHQTDIVVYLPQSVILTKSVQDAIIRANRIMEQNNRKLTVERYNAHNLLSLLGKNSEKGKKIVIADNGISKYINELTLDKNYIELFKDIRILNMIIQDEKDERKRSAYQARMIMTAVLARLIEKENPDFLCIKNILLGIFNGAFAPGQVDTDDFIDRLADGEDEDTNIKDIIVRLNYFLSDTRAISLIKGLELELRMVREFWTYA